MALKEIQIKEVGELPTDVRAVLKEELGPEGYSDLLDRKGLVEVQIENSVPRVKEIKEVKGTYGEWVLQGCNGGKPIKNIFKY